jgi:GH24 family phage-related lysozyme (muramidase)
MALELTDIKTGEKLTNAEKSSLFDKIQSEIQSKIFSERNYANIQVSMDDIREKFDSQISKSYNEIAKVFPDFNTYPVPAQQALTDMQFNMGSAKFSASKWPNLFAAVETQDWAKAAKEGSERKDVQQSRRDWTRDLFLSAL